MGTKEKIIEKVQHIQDESLLQHLLKMIDCELGLHQEVYRLSKEENEAIREGEQDLKDGNIYTQEEVRKLTEEWFKKK